jgi:3-mercaptopyruvate sulfurtransferase SseA
MFRAIASKLTFFVLIPAIALTIVGCSDKKSDADLSMLNPAEGRELVQGKSKLLGLAGKDTGIWVDARSEADYKAGHIAGALSLPYERVNADHVLLKGHDIIIVYGNDYNDPRANGMSKRLMALGYKDVRTLNGGIRAWKADGNELVQ